MKKIPIFLRLIHGRCGSTLMMQLLSSGKNVYVDNKYPYENRYLSYFDKAASIIGNDPLSTWTNDSLISEGNNLLGPIPYNDIEIFDKKNLSNELRKRFLNTLFDMIISKEKCLNEECIYYPEKATPQAIENYNNIALCKNIFLIRDPRDIFISIREFNKKRDFLGFGWKEKQSEADFIRELCVGFKQYLHHFSSIEEDERRFKIKYEDIIKEPYNETKRLSKWLGSELDYDFVLGNRSNVKQHLTTKEGDSSNLRWEKELSDELKSIFIENIGQELKNVGYKTY
ncbi:sulfotransferase domain-containing protein [Pseudoalteromonas sp. A3]|uniref:sulfotransferase domain-containing protein n=1 Tax=Pseudoalteromonas sp. A3 TaxID=142792 RepID=UPI002220ACF1|nr:sulfotransferase domain-containing protein [Pseudoalteromonas sp. A3]MCW1718687.1 sulfotransferase domain-containing protein [Pseudoalteromonas sp. A3]